MEQESQAPRKKSRLRRMVIVLAWVVSLIVLYYGISDWTGRQAWNQYRRDYEARAGSLDLTNYIPKEIPDAENFAATPFVRSWFNQSNTNFLYDHDAYQAADNLVGPGPKSSDGLYKKRFEDLVAWQQAFAAVHDKVKNKDKIRTDRLDAASRAAAAPAVLEALKDDAAALEELRAASLRPEARYGIIYNMGNPWTILLPHLFRVKQTLQRLRLRSMAELAAGQSEAALADVKLMCYVSDSMKSEPFLISYLLRIACVNITVETLHEGLAEHRWTDEQLQALSPMLKYDWLAEMQRPLQSEDAAAVLTVDLFRIKGLGLLVAISDRKSGNSFSDDEKVLNVVGHLLPSGWYDREKRRYCELFEEEFRGSMDLSNKRVFPHQIDDTVKRMNLKVNKNENNILEDGQPPRGRFYALTHHEFISSVMLPALARVPIKTAKAQTATDEALIACALERYRLAHGQFPDSLAALKPAFIDKLPHDIITGERFKYRNTGDGKFLLYSVGWNETDDNGVPGPLQYDETAGDWVWSIPAP